MFESEVQNQTIKLGKCAKFCPANEYRMRIREKLVHKFESSKNGYQLVKQYSRPAAGQRYPGEKDVRSPEILVQCVKYLISTVMKAEVGRCDLQDLYDFLFDRLRAVRQDMVVQSAVPAQDQLLILSICVRFHLVMSHLLERHTSFSAHINSQHQLECVKSCLLLQATLEDSNTDTLQCVYLLSNLDSSHAVNWVINQPKRSRSDCLDMCLNIAHSYREGNYVRFFRMTSRLPLLLLMAVFKYRKLILGHSVNVNKLAYKSPNIRYPCDHLAKLLQVSTPGNLEMYLKCMGLKVDYNYVWFGVSGDARENETDKLASDCYFDQINDQVSVADMEKMLLDFSC